MYLIVMWLMYFLLAIFLGPFVYDLIQLDIRLAADPEYAFHTWHSTWPFRLIAMVLLYATLGCFLIGVTLKRR